MLRAAVLLVTGLAFARTIGHGFLLWDDSGFITENPLVAHPTARSFVTPWTTPLLDLYAPLTAVVWAALSAGIGLAPWAFHALNVLLHVLNTSLVLSLLDDIAGVGGGAAAGALLFAVHPVQVEAVAWASETKDLLAALFSLIAMRAYLVARARGDRLAYVGGSIAFAGALLAKTSAVVAPILLVVLDRMRYGRSWREILRGVGPWLIAAAAFAFLTTRVQPAVGPLRWTAPLRLRPVLALDALSFYLATLVFPFRLVPDYGRTTISLLATGVLRYTWIPSALVLGAAWLLRRWLPALALGVALLVAGVAPVLGLVPFDYQYFSNVADHYLYLAMLGPAVTLALGYRALPAPGRTLVHATLALLLGLTVVQTAYWADDGTLYARIIAVNPLSSMAHSNLGRTLEEHGQYDAALASYREALRLDPGNEAALVNVGNVLYKKGDYEGVIAHYSALLAAVPPTNTAARMHNNLGAAYLKTERYEDGMAEFRQAIAIDPAYLEPYYNLGITLMALGRPAEAVPVLQQGVAIDPAHAALRNQLDAALAQAGSR